MKVPVTQAYSITTGDAIIGQVESYTYSCFSELAIDFHGLSHWPANYIFSVEIPGTPACCPSSPVSDLHPFLFRRVKFNGSLRL